MGAEVLDELFAVIEERRDRVPSGSYVAELISKGRFLGKIEEESGELVEAGRGEDRDAITHEAADLIFHTMVLLAAKGVKLDDVMEELRRRRR